MSSTVQTWCDDQGLLHREDGPALVETNKSEKWYKHGKLHREDGPAKVMAPPPEGHPNQNGYWGKEEWFWQGQPHREGGPAITLGNGIKKWFRYGQLHREDGPAVLYPDGGEEYWVNGRLHRDGGPAFKNARVEAWFLNGKLHRTNGAALEFFELKYPAHYGPDTHKIYQIIKQFCWMAPIAKAQEKQWWVNGRLHRDDGPAVEYGDGTQKWFSNGKIHRNDKPAVLYPNGSKEWWHHGRLSNKNGPAVEVAEGYFIYNQGYKNIVAYSWNNPKYLQAMLRRMEAIELPISEIDKTETRKPYANRDDVVTYRIYRDRGECHTKNEYWKRGKKIIRTIRILIIGGYGNFGSFISRTLASEPNITVIVAGRSKEKAEALAREIGGEAARVDIGAGFAEALKTIRPDIVIHTSGPFQAQGYDVAKACIEAGAHYIDLADGREFVEGITALNKAAKDKDILVISGASSVPCLTSALVDHYKNEFDTLEALDYGITTAQKTARGLATTAAVLSYTGKPIPTLIDGKMSKVYGWQGLHTRKYKDLGWRLLGNCDVPDLALFPKRYPSLKTIRFYAGLELPFIHITLWALSWLVRIGLIKHMERAAPLMLKISYMFDWLGSANSAFHMELSGKGKDGADKKITFDLTARKGDGPYIPCMPAILLAKKLANDELQERGAHPCVGFITKDEYLGALSEMHISWREDC